MNTRTIATTLFAIALFIVLSVNCWAQTTQNRQIQGSGPFTTLPGRDVEERRVMNVDVARANPGDYFWRTLPDGESAKQRFRAMHTDSKGVAWGWYTINQGDVGHAQQYDFMAGFIRLLPGISESGEIFTEYKKNDNYFRRLYDRGIIEDLITENSEFNRALTEFRKRYPNPIPRRRSDNVVGTAKDQYRTNDVPGDFPNIFWAQIIMEGRIMKVAIANGYGYRLSISYWATDDFMKEYPGTQWLWAGVDNPHGTNGVPIEEDALLTFLELQYDN